MSRWRLAVGLVMRFKAPPEALRPEPDLTRLAQIPIRAAVQPPTQLPKLGS